MPKTAFAALAASFVLVAVPASASTQQTVTVQIGHADLDLSSPAQVDVLKERIEAAATKACKTKGALYAGWSSVDQDCVREATTAALSIAEARIPATVASAE